MKMKKFLPFFLCAGLLASCGGTTPVDSSTSEAGKSDTKVASSSSKATTEKSSHAHTFDETKWESNATQHWHPATCEHTTQKGSAAAHDYVEVAAEGKAATCSEEGKKVEECKICKYKKETTLPKLDHTWGTPGAEVKPEGKTGYTVASCSVCHKEDLVISALDWTFIEGTNKDSTNETLKLKSNGNYVDYEFDMPKALTNVTVAFFGRVSADNTSYGFINSGEPNMELSLNDVAMEITNTKSFSEMGFVDSGDGECVPMLVELGTVASIAAGAFKFTYKRLGSYNLNITKIHFMYNVAN